MVSPRYFVSGKARGGSGLYAHLYFAHQEELSKFIWSAWAQDCMKWSPQVCLPSQFEFQELKKAGTRPFTKPQEIGMIWLIICGTVIGLLFIYLAILGDNRYGPGVWYCIYKLSGVVKERFKCSLTILLCNLRSYVTIWTLDNLSIYVSITVMNIIFLVKQNRVSPHSPRMAILRKINPADIIKLGTKQLKHDSCKIHTPALHEENVHTYHSVTCWMVHVCIQNFLSAALLVVLIVWFVTIATSEK